MAGADIVIGIDNWQDALITFEKNHPGSTTINLDLSDFSPAFIDERTGGNFDIVVGGPPCQGFSISGKRDPNDPRNKLYLGFVRAVEYFKPTIFLMENVPNLVSMDGGKLADEIIKDLPSTEKPSTENRPTYKERHNKEKTDSKKEVKK